MTWIQSQFPLSVSAYDLISWTLVIVGFMLWLHERKKNDNKKHYMVIQGIMHSLKEKAIFYNSLLHKADAINDREMLLLIAKSDFSSISQVLMGELKSFELKKDIPFDMDDFLAPDYIKKLKNHKKTNPPQQQP